MLFSIQIIFKKRYFVSMNLDKKGRKIDFFKYDINKKKTRAHTYIVNRHSLQQERETKKNR